MVSDNNSIPINKASLSVFLSAALIPGEDPLAMHWANFCGEKRCEKPAERDRPVASPSRRRSGTMLFSVPPRSRRLAWGGLLATTAFVLAVALSTPLLSPAGRAAVMHLFAPVCHQIPVRSPFVDGVQLALCDRCTGIYLGLVIGVATVGVGHGLWRRAGRYGGYLFLGSLVPMGIDWIGPLLGLWANGPVSRALTGLLFGGIAASFVADRLLWRNFRQSEATSPTEAEDTGFA